MSFVESIDLGRDLALTAEEDKDRRGATGEFESPRQERREGRKADRRTLALVDSLLKAKAFRVSSCRRRRTDSRRHSLE